MACSCCDHGDKFDALSYRRFASTVKHPLVIPAAEREMHQALRGRFFLCGRPVGAVPGCDTPRDLPPAGIARIQCTNPGCRVEYFRPFSCKVFHLCPSCSQKRTLLFGEYMNEQLLLRLPHRQFVFTIPKVLRVFFRHDRRLHGEISRLVYGLVRDFATAAAGKRIRTAAVVVFQT